MEAECPRAVPVLGPIQRTSDAELHRPCGIDQAFLDRSATPRAMGVALSPVVVPGVRVGVEIDQADRPMPLENRAELSEGDGMVSANSEWNHAGIQNQPEALFDDSVRCLHVSRDHR